MKKLKNLGQALSKAEQKIVNGGASSCYKLYIGENLGNKCYVPERGFGTVINNQCCI
ncbi:hypothetical protein [uncultured Olleya sp.]|uniref:hypothetical protein n=1 Tax=uncultured Olleya sp. TaxID=757243 RepID=UPI002598DB22|nr:hypothetical protein [uncultured Olleya sp.]